VEELRQLQRLVARSMVEQESHGVTEDFSQQPTAKVPEVARPHPLYGVTSRKLAENGVDAVAKAAQEGTLSRSGISFLGGVRSQKLYTHRRQLLLGLRRMVVAVPDDQAGGGLDEFGEDRELVDVGRSH
jgi:hypothetical protein